jgi:hypothetical protein
MAIKRKLKKEEASLDDIIIPTDYPKQVLDDQTPIDSLEKKKGKDDLQGFDKRLPAGVERTIRVDRNRLGDKNPIIIVSENIAKPIGAFDEIKIEGDCQLDHQIETSGCGTGKVAIKTRSAILVKRKK